MAPNVLENLTVCVFVNLLTIGTTNSSTADPATAASATSAASAASAATATALVQQPPLVTAGLTPLLVCHGVASFANVAPATTFSAKHGGIRTQDAHLNLARWCRLGRSRIPRHALDRTQHAYIWWCK